VDLRDFADRYGLEGRVLTEVAEFNNPLFRVMTRIFGQTKYMDEHLEDLTKKFGETATVM
jgi:hypothetical protein